MPFAIDTLDYFQKPLDIHHWKERVAHVVRLRDMELALLLRAFVVYHSFMLPIIRFVSSLLVWITYVARWYQMLRIAIIIPWHCALIMLTATIIRVVFAEYLAQGTRFISFMSTPTQSKLRIYFCKSSYAMLKIRRFCEVSVSPRQST
jgi:hypothetical protein